MPLRGFSDRFAAQFPDELRGPRTLGREAEYPVVDAEGHAADVRPLLEAVARLPGAKAKRQADGMVTGIDAPFGEYALEVGWGTVEVIVGPEPDLHALDAAHQKALAPVLAAAEAQGVYVLGLGTQPRTGPTEALLSPKPRYRTLLETLGEGWLWFTVTASDQVHVDVCRPELVELTNLMNLLAAPLVALTANSPLLAGASTGHVSTREARMGQLHPATGRHGLPRGPVDSVHGWIEHLGDQPVLVAGEYADPRPGDGRPFRAHAEEGADWDAFHLHEHYVWNTARPRGAHATVELRAACQQPPDSGPLVAALALGWAEAAPELREILRDRLGDDPWPAMRAWHEQVLDHGLRADEPRSGLIDELLAAAEEGLRSRGRDEAAYLEPLKARARARKSPADEALELFQLGWRPLVEARRLRRA